jgi:hypothetical protein
MSADGRAVDFNPILAADVEISPPNLEGMSESARRETGGGSTEPHVAERRLASLRVSHDRRVAGLFMQPRCRWPGHHADDEWRRVDAEKLQPSFANLGGRPQLPAGPGV